MTQRRRERALAHEPREEPRRDPLARWRSFEHRGTAIEFVVSGVLVDAATPAEMVAATDAEIVRRSRHATQN